MFPLGALDALLVSADFRAHLKHIRKESIMLIERLFSKGGSAKSYAR
jgi:hypothetical protein